ncbi:MAG: hypothetical protein ACXWL2_02540 [Candidatus Chromulinivorax sp.]
MNIKTSLYLTATLLCLYPQATYTKDVKTVILNSQLLKVADNAGLFHTPMVDILQSRIDFVNLVQGEKKWHGAVINFQVITEENQNLGSIDIYCRRPEIICGATFVVISPDHKLAEQITNSEHHNFIAEKTAQTDLFKRQMAATNDAIFTGSYAINPFTQERLPIFVSDYAIECFDMRTNHSRLAVPAHNSKDLAFAHKYKLPIKLVVDVQNHLHGKKDDLGPVVAAPLLDKHGNLTEAYLGEYGACITVNSGVLNNASLKDAAAHVIHFLEENNCGYPYNQTLLYNYNGKSYSIKDLAKLENALAKTPQNQQTAELKKELAIALNYIQADFLEIGEKFLINVKNTKDLMIALIEESCEQRENNDCYLLRWAHLKGEFDEKSVFRRDITSIRDFTIFCKDLVNFLSDFAHSCPKALENIRKQN